MYQIKKNNVITLTRGDYLEIPVSLTVGIFPFQEQYELEEGDLVFFGLMYPKQPFEKAIIKKTYGYEDLDSEGNLFIKILPEDTLCLEPGTYYYAIKTLYQEDEENVVDTIVNKTKFILVD